MIVTRAFTGVAVVLILRKLLKTVMYPESVSWRLVDPNDAHSISKSHRTRRRRARMSRDNPSFPIDALICHLRVCLPASLPSYLPSYFLSISLPSYGCTPGNKTEFLASQNLTEEEFQDHPTINWEAILWVRRPLELWVVQVILAMVSLTEALLLAYLGYKVRYSSLSRVPLVSDYLLLDSSFLSIRSSQDTLVTLSACS